MSDKHILHTVSCNFVQRSLVSKDLNEYKVSFTHYEGLENFEKWKLSQSECLSEGSRSLKNSGEKYFKMFSGFNHS